MTLKITCGDQIFRIPCESGLALKSFASLQASAQAVLALAKPFRARYKNKDGESFNLSDDTFSDFLSTASRATGSSSRLLKLEVLDDTVQDISPTTSHPWAWQEDPRDLEELLAQFSDDCEPKPTNRCLSQKCALTHKGKKKRRKKRTKNKAMVASEEVVVHHGHANEMENEEDQIEEARESVPRDEGERQEEQEPKEEAEALEDDAPPVVSRSQSCPCLLTWSAPEDSGGLWPATPDSTPSHTPRNSCGQHFLFAPMPVMVLPVMPISAF